MSKTELIMVKDRGGLFPRDPYSDELLSGLVAKRDVVVNVFQQRDTKQLKLLFAMLKLASANDPLGRSVDELVDFLKLRAGLVKEHIVRETNLHTGEITHRQVWVAKSISFSAMPQEKFTSTFNRFLDTIITDILPGLSREEVSAEILEAIAS